MGPVGIGVGGSSGLVFFVFVWETVNSIPETILSANWRESVSSLFRELYGVMFFVFSGDSDGLDGVGIIGATCSVEKGEVVSVPLETVRVAF